ncbi:uncharacterized protein LOC128209636 [Mya arenaria]|uniref:uncharacterized protein LOC128209636 n=1 Tax=Mya arenaria TaxID=6604 RepID=UPI0022E351A5|nr:uncharacterized protein LOC128209636 [Mya arenaria]
MSQFTLSQASTVPYDIEYIQNDDPDFANELLKLDNLYFNELVQSSQSQNIKDSDERSILSCFINNDDSDCEINNEQESDCEHDVFETSFNDDVLTLSNDYDGTSRPEDVKEIHNVNKLRAETCGCKGLYNGKPCSSVVDFEKLLAYRQNCMDLSNDERELVIKSLLLAHRVTTGNILSNKKSQKTRVKPSQMYYFMGHKICKTTFIFAHATSYCSLQRMAKSLDSEGIKPRIHGNKHKAPANALSFTDQSRLKTFIENYATDNALPLPGRLPHCPNQTVLLLPSDVNISEIHEIYQESAVETGYRQVCLKTFRNIWNELCPHIALAKPTTDLCFKCQKFGVKLGKSGQLSDEDKNELVSEYEAHLSTAKKQREQYKELTAASKDVHSSEILSQGAEPCSQDVHYHYSWDFAQQVHYPHHAQQVGPIYFATPRKCQVFGMCAEGSGKQTFYLVDEAELPGKGSDSVVSMAHHYFQHFGVGEKHAEVHFDNAVGQNKNHTVLWYAMWRVMTGLHESVTLNTMLAGHTKFAPDCHFGIWKVKWRCCNAENLQEIAHTVSASSKSGHNIPQLVNDPQQPVTFHSWKSFLNTYFKTLKNITKYHHFHVSKQKPGVVVCKEFVDSSESEFNLLRMNPECGILPELKHAPCLDAARQWYLHDSIGPFFRSESSRSAVCPKPTMGKVKVDIGKNDTPKGSKRKHSLLC